MHGVGKDREIAGEQRVDRQEAGDQWRPGEALAQAALQRKERNEKGEDQLEDDAPDKGRGADPDERDQARRVVAGPLAEMRRGDAKGYAPRRS